MTTSHGRNVPTDAELMEQLATGDPAPLGELYVRYGRMVCSLISNYAPTLAYDEVEDVCHEVFLTLHRRAKSYREHGKLRSFVCGVAIRKARTVNRTRSVRSRLLGNWASGGGGQPRRPTGPDVRVETEELFNKALAQLSPKLREVLWLHAVEELEGEEIATALGLSINAVWTRLHRARKAVQDAIEAMS